METISRKAFIHKAGCSIIALAAMGITVTSCDSSEVAGQGPNDPPGGTAGITITANSITLDLSQSALSVLSNSGGFLLISAGGAMVVNVGGVIRAFTNVCTHEQCTTDWSFGNSRFTCNCHGSQFNTSGQVIVGPAVSPLKEFSTTRNGNIVVISRS